MPEHGDAVFPTLVGYPHRDVLGKFKLKWDQCEYCKSDGQVVVEWWRPDFVYFHPTVAQAFVDGRLILKRNRGHLGITCGCYAKLHRQLIHINLKRG